MQQFNRMLVLLLAVATLNACKQADFKKTKEGLAYQIFEGNGKEKIAQGTIFKYYMSAKFKDSVLVKHGLMPGYAKMDSAAPSRYDFNDVLKYLKVGDSCVVSVPVDTLIAKSLVKADFMGAKKGDVIKFFVRMVKTFKDEGEAQKEYQEDMKKAQVAMAEEAKLKSAPQVKELEDYLKKNNITTVKGAMGTYVEVVNPPGAAMAKEGQMVSVKYTGMTMDGKKFDSNVDTSFHHTEPYQLTLGQGGVIQGWEDGLKLFAKGGKGKIYIPSYLGYGEQGNPPTIPANANLIFEIEMLDVKDPAPMPAMPEGPAPKGK
jgi:FKBP-type peptidyl-prolyl cis-trans isomerase FkpA